MKKIVSLYDPRVPPHIQPEVAFTVPQAVHDSPFTPLGDADRVGSDLHVALKCGAQANSPRGKRKCMDLVFHVYYFQHDSLHVPITHARPMTPIPPGIPDQGKPPDGPPTIGGDILGGN